MDRRGFLSKTAKLGTGSLVVSCLPAPVLALAEDTRQRLWYSSHCCCCGYEFPARFLAGLKTTPVQLICEFCKWHVIPSLEGDYVMPVPEDWVPSGTRVA